jgi:hypothetical protein
MAVARKTSQTKPDRVLEAAVEYFAGRSHDAWRKALLRTNPEQKGQPRMRLRGGKMVDINQPWAKLDPAAKEDNKRAARDAFDAVAKFPNDREAASDYVHKRWIARNKHDKSLDKALFTPYDRMKQAIAAVRKGAKVKAPAKTRPSAYKSVRIDAKNWARLEAAAGKLTKLTGQSVAPEALLMAGLEAIVAVTGAVSGKPKAKKR